MTPTNSFSQLIVAENTFTNILQMDRGQTAALSIVDPGGGGAFTNATTVTIQRRYNQHGDWRDVQSYTTPQEIGFFAECGMEIRMGIKTGALHAGDTVTLEGKTG